MPALLARFGRSALCRLAWVLMSGALLALGGCASSPAPHGGWYALRWMEKPARPSQSATVEDTTAADDMTRFVQIASHDPKEGDVALAAVVAQLQEGDVIAYRLGAWEARMKLLTGDVGKIGYRLFRYGHLAVMVRDPDDENALRVFSSEMFRGANTRFGVESLAGQHFDVFRLEHNERIQRKRLNEFVQIALKKSGNLFGYDFSGVFGLWNSRMTPDRPEAIGSSYICSTVVVTAFYYAGVRLDVSARHGVLDLVTPLQVVEAEGRFIPVVEGALTVETSDEELPAPRE